MTPKFLAIGECMVEMAPKWDDLFGMGFAGDTFNTAWNMRQITQGSVDVAYVSAVGEIPFRPGCNGIIGVFQCFRPVRIPDRWHDV